MTQFVDTGGGAPRGYLAGMPPCGPADAIDRFILRVGGAFSVIWLLLVLLIILSVLERYFPPATRVTAMVFGPSPSTALGELQWWLYAAGFLVALSYAMVRGAHVRVDVLSERLSLRGRAWIELFGTVFFLLPFAGSIVLYGIPFVVRSVQLNEVSSSPGGLAGTWFIKSFMLVGFGLLLLAAFARIWRMASFLFGRDRQA